MLVLDITCKFRAGFLRLPPGQVVADGEWQIRAPITSHGANDDLPLSDFLWLEQYRFLYLYIIYILIYKSSIYHNMLIFFTGTEIEIILLG